MAHFVQTKPLASEVNADSTCLLPQPVSIVMHTAAAHGRHSQSDFIGRNAWLVRDSRQSLVVEFHFFGGLTIKEIAYLLGVSVGTVKRDLTLAKLWLLRELGRGLINDAETL